MSQTESADLLPDLEELFEEYLARRDDNQIPEAGDLFGLAGERASELKERIRLYEAIRRTSDLVRGSNLSEGDEEDSQLLYAGLDDYENLQRIGDGGQARVYKAKDKILGRDVAIKFLRLERVAPGDMDQLLQAEAQALGRLTNSCVVTVHSLAKLGDMPYMVMEYVLAPTLREVIDAISGKAPIENDPRPDAEVRVRLLAKSARALTPLPARMRFIARIAEALEYCHAEGVLHRDIKPENVLVTPDGDEFAPRLVDFGLSFSDRRQRNTLGLSERFMVTLAYSAPEQLASEKLGSSARAEQFSLATLAYETLTGVHPFEGNIDHRGALSAMRNNVLRASPPPMRGIKPEIPADLEAVVSHAHERTPELRYAHIGDFGRDLDAILSFRSISIQRHTVWGESIRFLRRNRARILRWGLGVLLVLSVPLAMLTSKAESVRSELAEELIALQTEAEGWSKDWDFEDGWQRYGGLVPRAKKLDGEWLWPWLFGDMDPLAESTGRDLSNGMEQTIDRLIARRNPFDDPGTVITREVLQLWKVPLALERANRPDIWIRLDKPIDKSGSPFLSFGDKNALVQKQIAPDGFDLTLAFSPREARETPGPGSYRYLSWEDPTDPIATYEFELALPTRTLPEPGRFSRDRLDSMLFIESFERDFFLMGGEGEDGELIEGSLTLPYPIKGSAFYVSDLVTWGELAEAFPEQELSDLIQGFSEFLSKTEATPAPHDYLHADAPAFVGPRIATRYALAVGARLPSASELFFAYEQGLLQPRDLPGEWPHRMEGELTGSYHPTTRMMNSVRPEVISRNTVLQSLNMLDTGRTYAFLHFRIARTRATKAELEEL